MTYRIAPRRFRLVIDPQRFRSWSLDTRLDFRRLGMAIRFIDQCNSDEYQGYGPGELRCIGFDSTKRGQTIIEFEEAYALPDPDCDDCVAFSSLPPGRWQEIPTTNVGPIEYVY